MLIQALFKTLHKLLDIEEKLTLSLGDVNMNETTKALLKRVDDATNAIAAKLQALIDKANQAGSVTADEINAVLAPEVDKLEEMGKSENV